MINCKVKPVSCFVVFQSPTLHHLASKLSTLHLHVFWIAWEKYNILVLNFWSHRSSIIICTGESSYNVLIIFIIVPFILFLLNRYSIIFMQVHFHVLSLYQHLICIILSNSVVFSVNSTNKIYSLPLIFQL